MTKSSGLGDRRVCPLESSSELRVEVDDLESVAVLRDRVGVSFRVLGMGVEEGQVPELVEKQAPLMRFWEGAKSLGDADDEPVEMTDVGILPMTLLVLGVGFGARTDDDSLATEDMGDVGRECHHFSRYLFTSCDNSR
jgi:hypothetical protein